MPSYALWFVAKVAQCARDGFALAMSRDFSGEPLYLYFKRGDLRFAHEAPGEEWELGCGERMPLNLTQEQLTGWVHTRSTRLSCLPLDV